MTREDRVANYVDLLCMEVSPSASGSVMEEALSGCLSKIAMDLFFVQVADAVKHTHPLSDDMAVLLESLFSESLVVLDEVLKQFFDRTSLFVVFDFKSWVSDFYGYVQDAGFVRQNAVLDLAEKSRFN